MPRPKPSKAAIKAAIRRFVASGEHATNAVDWPGQNIIEVQRSEDEALTNGLLAEVRARSVGITPPGLPAGLDIVGFTRRRVLPMVEGLFPQKEHEPVLALLERSVAFVTADNVEQLVKGARSLHTAWSVADLYLGSIGARILRKDGLGILGMNVETTCYVALDYFTEDDQFADFVVHECAHMFHNWKRRYAGLPDVKNKEWLLQIEFRRREEFAYSCEFFSRILALASNSAERKRLAEECIAGRRLGDSADQAFVAGTLREAAAARNGWKRILQRCAAAPPLRGAALRAWQMNLGKGAASP